MTPLQSMSLHRARWLIAALRVRTAILRMHLVLRAYNPGQLRVPAGNPDGGQWTDEDGGGSRPYRDDGRIILVSDEGDRRYTVVLSEEEARGGHTLYNHVGKTDGEMLARVIASRRDYFYASEGLKRAGSFESTVSANDFVNRTLEQNSDEVDLVASGKQNEGFITSRFGYKTGREAYTDGYSKPYMRNTYGVGVFIVHDPTRQRGYRVHTAYPRNDGD